MQVIPLQQQRRPEGHAAYRLATELGATVLPSVGPAVTHVVAGSHGTDKVRWARGRAGVRVRPLGSTSSRAQRRACLRPCMR